MKDNFRKPIGIIAREVVIEMKTSYKKNLFGYVLLLIFLLMIFNSCQENREVLETDINNSELLLEQTDGQPERLFMSEEGQLESLPFTLLYKYDGYWSMRFGNYYELDDRDKNVSDYLSLDECNINDI
jgi:hypothetical protein